MFNFFDKKIEKIFKKKLYHRKKHYIEKAIDTYKKMHTNADEETIKELKKQLELEAERVIVMINKSILHASIKRAKYTFWITLILSLVLIGSISIITNGAGILLLVPFITASIGWISLITTIPISYNDRLKGGLDTVLLAFEKNQTNDSALDKNLDSDVKMFKKIKLNKNCQPLNEEMMITVSETLTKFENPYEKKHHHKGEKEHKHGVIFNFFHRRHTHKSEQSGKPHCNQIKLKNIPVIVRSYKLSNQKAVTLIENIQRENLNPLEEAHAINELLIEYQMTHHEVAESIGKSRATVTNLLRLLNLEESVKDNILEKKIEMGHARALLGLNGQEQIEAAGYIIEKKLSVRQAEKLIREKLVVKANNSEKNLLYDRLQSFIGKLPIEFAKKITFSINKNGEGKILIKFNTAEEAECIFEHFIS